MQPRLREGHEIVQSFDARDWARDFVAHVKAHPGIPADEETMTTWFANALMRGWDESQRLVDAQQQMLGSSYVCMLERSEIRGAVARGWCSEENSHKAFDGDLANGIINELEKLRTYNA